MRCFVALATLLLAACLKEMTGTGAAIPSNAYALESVDRDALPAPADYSTGSRWVVSGSLTLQPDGHFILSESDSVWNGRAFARQEWTEGGLWSADGSVLSLSDTSSVMSDAYGAGAATYVGTLEADVVLLTVWTDDGTEVHNYRYKR